ncbi:MAG: DegT/DnrJ/EryC1/StrS family aminotransferase [Clostridia bacterium]|nr:DegT/DnrJ/EryC1/StrS family aminotransferase [Clostridia bacterium]
MEWYEHDHKEAHSNLLGRETPELSASDRLSLRLSRFFHVEFCHLAQSSEQAVDVALKALFSPDLGERSAAFGDEIIVISAENTFAEQWITARGGAPVDLRLSPNDFSVKVSMLEERLSLSTKAVWVEHGDGFLANPLVVRNFCNKYDLWMLEHVGRQKDVCYEIDGHAYQIGTIGDWSICDLTASQSCGALLTRDKMLSSLLRVHMHAHGAVLSEKEAEAILAEVFP